MGGRPSSEPAATATDPTGPGPDPATAATGQPRMSACPVAHRSGSRRGYLIPGLVAMAALLAIGGALGAGDLVHRSGTSLHGADVSQQLALAIQARAGSHTQPDVQCPPSEPIRTGWHFTCTIDSAGATRQIAVEEVDSRGHLRWQLGS